MVKERKKLIMYFVGITVLLVAGIVIGYYFWGIENKKNPIT